MSSCTERKPIRHRTESDWTANGIRSDGGQNPIGRRTQTVGGAAVSAAPTKPTELSTKGVQLSPLGFAACQSKNCTNKTNRTIHQGVQLSQLHQQNLQISFHEPQPDPRPARYHAPRSHEQPIAPINGHYLLAAFHRIHDVRSHMLR